MEWLEVTGRTVAQAEEAALDQLGVDRSEAEFTVLEQPKGGILGLGRTDARVRARVKPVQAQEKQKKRRPKNNRSKNRSPNRESNKHKSQASRKTAEPSNRQNNASNNKNRTQRHDRGSLEDKERTSRSANTSRGVNARKGKPMEEAMSLEEQTTVLVDFLDGLVDAFELEAVVSADRVSDDTVELRVENADGVGLLIGPKGNTLRAVEDLSRMLVQRKSDGNCEGRVRVDIGGYRERRRAALEEFCVKVALEARDTGQERPLEPMNAADRKVAHDAVTDIEGVSTVSEGQEPRRWVVIVPD
ncbi:MAG: Jag N-terminal domain-containing protein [bacterium]|nr:Jag N-terminal domain-containing protein [bacterium]MCY4258187.1 Jag N-terminal domain-containing protein [bacterium]